MDITNRIICCPLLSILLLMPFDASAARQSSANQECATCHIMWLTEFKRKNIKTLVPYDPRPVVDTGKQDVTSTERMCFSCHDGFVLDSRFMWEPGKHAHPVGQKPSKKISIPRENGKNIFPLNDEGRIYCGTCHSAHGVDWDDKEATIFMRVRDVDGKLCIACHQDKTKGPDHGMHPVNQQPDNPQSKPPRKLIQAGARFGRKGEVICQSCHRSHAAPEKNFLVLKNEESQLCGACHDDQFAINISQAGLMGTHPVNLKPQHARIPESLIKAGARTGKQGEIICQTCHKPHAAKGSQGLLLADNPQDALCQSCHKKQKSILNSKHDMSLASKDSQNIRKQLASESGACSACHVPHKGNGPKMWARPRDVNEDPMASLCLSCHNRDGMDKKHTVGRYSHPVGVNVAELGRTVSLPTFSNSGIKWQDVKAGKVSCASCHDPHQWDPDDVHNKAKPGEDKGDSTNRFLRIANGPQLELCKACHEDKWNIANSKHDMQKLAPDSTNALQQTADESGICGACHLVHNARGNHLSARDVPAGKDSGPVACMGCHDEDGLAKDKSTGKHSHPVNVTMKNLGIKTSSVQWIPDRKSMASAEGLIDGDLVPLPLYDANGHPGADNGRIGCGTCHDPHNWSRLDEASIEDPVELEGDSGNSFLRIPDLGLSKLCVNCHFSKKSVYFTKHDLTDQLGKVSTQLEEIDDDDRLKLHLAGPCMHCHRPHNAKGPALWTRDTGPGETGITTLCTDCHRPDGLAKDKLAGEHVHPKGTGTGKLHNESHLPTFSAEGKRQPDGQGLVDCASCHDAHRWDPGDINNRSLPMLAEEGDASNSFLRLSADNNSDLCLNCHADKKTIIGSEHDMKHIVADATNILGQEQDVSGLCGQCHVPHNGVADAYIWAQKIGEGDDPIEQRCRSCHNPLGFAAHKDPALAKHPQQIKIWSTELRREFRPGENLPDTPVFDKDGKRSNFGSITCASCHNPHRWDANKDKGPGKNTEGDARTSFLRTSSSDNIVCVECHGEDAIFRYKYFHSESAHKK